MMRSRWADIGRDMGHSCRKLGYWDHQRHNLEEEGSIAGLERPVEVELPEDTVQRMGPDRVEVVHSHKDWVPRGWRMDLERLIRG